ncbi:MAG: putative inorganic carbon transporter subunit DabA, partial [Hydrogenobacter sp.]
KDYLKKPKEKVEEYTKSKAEILALSYYLFLANWTKRVGIDINSLSPNHVIELIKVYEKFKEEEGYIYLRALEDTHIDRLVKSIGLAQEEVQEKPLAQALFCIDVRSERFRRHLESLGRYETYGIAGFFGVPVGMVNLQKGHEEFLCPVIVTPKNVVFEVPYNKKGVEKEKVASYILHGVKDHILAPFVAVEMLGFAFGFDFLGKTFLPEKYLKFKNSALKDYTKTSLIINKLSDEEIQQIMQSYYFTLIRAVLREHFGIQAISDKVVSQIYESCLNGEDSLPEDLKKAVEVLRNEYKIERGYVELFRERLKSVGFTKEEQAFLIATALKSIGLTKEFAPIVLVLGHESRSENNPYESALDCGACGGASGIYNARIFCIMANDHTVRQIMAQKHGLEIPPDTVFIPGVHNTTTDEVFLYDLEFLPARYIPLMDKINQDLQITKELTLQERAKPLDARNPQDVYRKAYDWSEVRPEWGLSGNYAFIIGRRSITSLAKLDGRVFLHSYDYRVDKKGFLLENILAGPAVVGQWINSEYYFSTVDNEVYGSGSKVYHNVVGRIGVMTGNYSDLRTGLPAQTVLKEGKPFHVPVRYTLIIEAPFDLARNAINKIRKIRDLMQNEWINLLILDPETGVSYRYLEGIWVEYLKKEEVKA